MIKGIADRLLDMLKRILARDDLLNERYLRRRFQARTMTVGKGLSAQTGPPYFIIIDCCVRYSPVLGNPRNPQA
jgi:hypothetical protein